MKKVELPSDADMLEKQRTEFTKDELLDILDFYLQYNPIFNKSSNIDLNYPASLAAHDFTLLLYKYEIIDFNYFDNMDKIKNKYGKKYVRELSKEKLDLFEIISPVTPVIGAANSQNGALVYQDNHEAGQYITIEIYDSSNNIIKTYTNKTGIYGNITLDVNNLDIGEYSVIAYHISDEYYSSIYNSTTFTITTLKTNTTLNVNTTSIYIGDKVMITPVVKHVALQLQVVILKFMMAIH